MLVGVNLYRFLLPEASTAGVARVDTPGPDAGGGGGGGATTSPGISTNIAAMRHPVTLSEYMKRTKAKRQREQQMMLQSALYRSSVVGAPSTLPRRVQMLRSRSEDIDLDR